MNSTRPPSPDIDPHTYLATPASPSSKGVLAVHAWWGLNDFFRGFCDRLAQEGLLVLAPDLYHGAVATTIVEAQALRKRLKQAVVKDELRQAAEQLCGLCGKQEIGAVGFSLGAYWALWLSDQPDNPLVATTAFYGARSGDYSHSRSAYQFHLAESDPYEPASAVKKLQKALKAAGRPAEFHTYPGTGHWFFESDRTDAYHPQAAASAWSRTLDFLRSYLP